eukprot:UN12604
MTLHYLGALSVFFAPLFGYCIQQNWSLLSISMLVP